MGILSRLSRKLRRKPKRSRLSEPERALRYLWKRIENDGAEEFRPQLERPDLLVFQFGKVGSMALQMGAIAAGYNAFHCHGLSTSQLAREQRQLLESPASARALSGGIRRLHRATLLRLLVNWYRGNKTKNGMRLKVITLTRDPVDWYRSSLKQRFERDRDGILAWYRLNEPAADAKDLPAAMRALMERVMAGVPPLRPAHDADAAVAGAKRALETGAPAGLMLRLEILRCIEGLVWFDGEVRALLGLDVLAAPDLCDRGVVRLQNDFVDLLALRFELLADDLSEIGRFLDVPEFRLPSRNRSAEKPGADLVDAAFAAALATPAGRAYAAEMRATRFARACGYDRAPAPATA